jgi:hypothetical protein
MSSTAGSEMRERTIVRAVVIGAVAASVAAAGTLPAQAVTRGSPTPRDKPGPCPLPKADGEGIRHYSKRMIRCAVQRWWVPGGSAKAICVAKRESGLVPTASSPTGRYLGLFQHSAAAWGDRYLEWTHKVWRLKPNALNGRTNTVVTVRMVHAYGWAPWAGTGC